MTDNVAKNTAANNLPKADRPVVGVGEPIVNEPWGPKPRRIFSRRNIFLYGTLFIVAIYYALPLYVMVVTSLKGLPEIRLGNIFSPPLEITFAPWVKGGLRLVPALTAMGLVVDSGTR